MGVQVINPNTLDQLLEHLEHHFEVLERIAKAAEEGIQNEQYFRLKGNVQLDATGAGTDIKPVPLGYDWIMERITTTTSGGAGTCVLFENNNSPAEVLEEVANAGAYSDAFSNNIFIPSGSQLLVVFAGGGVNGSATYNIQVKRIKSSHHTHNPRATFLGDE